MFIFMNEMKLDKINSIHDIISKSQIFLCLVMDGKWPLSAVERGSSRLSENWYIIGNTFVYLEDLVTTVNQIQFDLYVQVVWNIFMSEHHVVDVKKRILLSIFLSRNTFYPNHLGRTSNIKIKYFSQRSCNGHSDSRTPLSK